MSGDGRDAGIGHGRVVARVVTGLLVLALSLVPVGPTAADPAPQRYLDPVFDDAVATTDIVYRQAVDENGNLVDLHLDVYEPAGDTAERRPVIVWIHGGFFSSGDKAYMAWHARESARRGYVGLTIQYRLRPGIGSPLDPRLLPAALDAYEDARAALDWVRVNAADLRADPDAIAVGGHSAGAVTALNVGYRPQPPETSNAQAVVSIAGISLGAPNAGEPPALMFHGTADTTVPYAWGQATCDGISSVGLLCEMVTFEGDGHMIAYTRAEEIMSGTAAFLAEQVLEPLGYFNDAPVADAGGPYEVPEGSTVALDATGSTDPDGDPLTFAWSPAVSLDDPASATPTYTGSDDGSETLTLTVADSWGATSTDEATVTTLNVAPTIDAVEPVRAPLRPRQWYLLASIADPGLLDTHSATIDWGDGTQSAAWVVQREGGALALAGHRYARFGSYRVTVTAADDGGGSASVARWLAVRPRP